MSDENFTFITGRVTRDPTVRNTPSGLAVCDLGVANNRYSKPDDDGQRTQSTTFVRCTVWDKGAEWIGEHVGVGDFVSVKGVLVDDNFKDKETDKMSSGRLKLDHCRITLLRKKRVEENPESTPVETPEIPEA